MMQKILAIALLTMLVAGCGTAGVKSGTLAELAGVVPDLQDVYLEDSLERAAQSYRRYLAETSESGKTPEAMRRLADLQLEQAYGVIGDGEIRDMAAPEIAARRTDQITARPSGSPIEPTESELEFERRASERTLYSPARCREMPS